VGLELDDRARHLLEHQRQGQAVSIVVVRNAGSPAEGLSVERCRATQAEHDSSLVRLNTAFEVPIYVHRRLATYLRWHTVRLTTWTLAAWHGLQVEGEGDVVRHLAAWERTHPGLCRLTLQASAG
jgi:hypothetical protein